MDAKYLTFNFANFVTINLMVAVLVAMVVLGQKVVKRGQAVPATGK